jgi:uncharacterized protein (TIGR01440 family)
MPEIKEELKEILVEFQKAANLKQGDILVIGCSTSEITGKPIGKAPAYEIGKTVALTVIEKFNPLGVYLAFQCCQHLNRALVVESELVNSVKGRNLEIVSVIPTNKAGCNTASAAYELFSEPVVVEFIKADAGIDIGDTFIGMHLKHVAIPVRLGVKKLGEANITFAKTRSKYIGGERAEYRHNN